MDLHALEMMPVHQVHSVIQNSVLVAQVAYEMRTVDKIGYATSDFVRHLNHVERMGPVRVAYSVDVVINVCLK